MIWDVNGQTALHYIAAGGDKYSVSHLISGQPALDVTNSRGEIAITVAMIKGFQKITNFLTAASVGKDIPCNIIDLSMI